MFQRSVGVLETNNLKFETPRCEVQIMACTADEDSVGYLNDIDERFRAVPLAIFSFQVFLWISIKL